jgi:hypothetical protein
MKPVILPDQLITPSPRYLKDITPGETVFTPFTALVVKADRTCYLAIDSEVCESDRQAIGVTKEKDGTYSVVVPPNRTYKPGGNLLTENHKPLVPVSSLKVSS